MNVVKVSMEDNAINIDMELSADDLAELRLEGVTDQAVIAARVKNLLQLGCAASNQTLAMNHGPVSRLGLATSMPDTLPAASAEKAALSPSVDPGGDMEARATIENPYPGLDVSQWM